MVMRKQYASGLSLLAALLVLASSSAFSAGLKGYGELHGDVGGTREDALAVVYAYNTERDLAYTVFVVDGKYRATNVIPGAYEITLRPAVGQMNGFAPQSLKRLVKADSSTKADFVLRRIESFSNYVGGLAYSGIPGYPDGKVLPYDEIFPPGPGREILERTCNACHSINFLPYNVSRDYSGGRPPKDRNAWIATVNRMHKVPGFGRPGRAPIFDPALLPPKDSEILIEYLSANFGPESEPRVVQLDSVPPLDKSALAKAMFVEYIYRETKGKYDVWPWPHQIDFDTDGNVWLAYTGCCIVRFDPRTGASKAFEGHGGGHGIAVDQTDGTVWYSGDAVRRLDPKTGLVDQWKFENDPALASNTQIFDSKGDLWMSLLSAGGLAKWDRKTDTLTWWEVPVIRSRPYGIIVDHSDKVWFADYHNGGITRFDPVTEKFSHFNLVREAAASSIRRLGVDSKNMIWAGTWASLKYIAKLYRLNPETGEVIEKPLTDLPYATTYNAEADSKDNIWLANDNYLSMYDQRSDRFTHFPLPVRSDSLKTTITRDDGVWFIYRNAGKYAGYGGSAVVLYPDKDRITTLAAYHARTSPGYRLSNYKGSPAPPVQGVVRTAPARSRNADEYAIWARDNGLLVQVQANSERSPEAQVVRPQPKLEGPAVAPVDTATLAVGLAVFNSNCIACHTLAKGGAHGVGPNLWNIFGSRAGNKPNFAYSPALENSGFTWTADSIGRWIAGPDEFVPGSIMASVPVENEAERKALLAFLRVRTDGGDQVRGAAQETDSSQRE